MISEEENTRISKFLSLVLRHKPDTIGITLDNNGWTDVEILINEVNKTDISIDIDIDILKHVVETNAKKRFAFNETFDKIRANQGHSVEIELGYRAQQPPTILYHGTAERFVAQIQEIGLLKMDRHHVHLSADVETAKKVGQRHGKPFVFEILAGQMFSASFEFYLSDNGVWLTDHVPINFLRRLGEGSYNSR
jgi:putative RNA 2'-phosphotransferase